MRDNYAYMKAYLIFVWIILFSTIVIATEPTIPCEPLEYDHSFYENIILNSKVANSPQYWSITKTSVNDCRIGNTVRVLVDYSSLPEFSATGLDYKTQINYRIENGILVNENEIRNLFDKLPAQTKKFENDARVKLFLDVTNADEVTLRGNSLNLMNPQQVFKTKAAGYQEDAIEYSLDDRSFQRLVLITPDLIEKKDLFLPDMFSSPKVIEFEEKVGIEKIEISSGKITLFEKRDCFTCRSELNFKDLEIIEHKLDYTLQWQNFPEVNKVKQLVSNELIRKYNPGCELHPTFSSTPTFTSLQGTGWRVLFTLKCSGEDRNYWREISFDFKNDGSYENFRIYADEQSMLNATRGGFSNGIFIALGGVAVIIILTIFFLVKRRREKGVL